MGQLAKRRISPDDRNQLSVGQPMMAWELLDDRKREIAEERMLLISPVLELIDSGLSRTAAIKHFMLEIDLERVGNPEILRLVAKHGRNDKPISRATWQNWLKAYCESGKVGLAPAHKGSDRKEWGWEARFHYYYDSPTKPKVLTVAHWLRTLDQFDTATNDRVYAYARTLSSKQGPNSRKRSGGHYYDQNIRPYRLLDSSVLPVGYMYEGDGHCCDVFVEHPVSGNHYRPELTVWIDKRSNYVITWTLSESENAINTIHGLLQALKEHDHVPAQLHVDPGSGFKNKAVTDEVNGLCARLSIEPIFARAGNARGKGLVEGWFGHFEERVGKLFESFCGHCRTDDALSRLEYRIKKGAINIPSLDQYKAALSRYFEIYNTIPQKELGTSPKALWETLERTPVNQDLESLYRIRYERQVIQWTVSVDKRKFRHNDLGFYDGKNVIVEVDPRSYDAVIVRDSKGVFICEAPQQQKHAYQPASLIEQKKLNSKKAAIERKQKHIREIEARNGAIVDAAGATSELDDFQASSLADQSDGPNDIPFDSGYSDHITPNDPEDDSLDDYSTSSSLRQEAEVDDDTDYL